MHYTTRKYFSALSIGLLLSQPLSAMHYLDRKLFVGIGIGALGTLSVLFIKKHFFTKDPSKSKSPNTKIISILPIEGRSDDRGIDITNNKLYSMTLHKNSVQPTRDGYTVSYENGASATYDKYTGTLISSCEGNDIRRNNSTSTEGGKE
ncbi:MAG TPA: hypothetical protein VGW78_01005 [Candidatus Babeliales bacterium]|jgi:hypothetical protein|nr:hypothetical protein [Candidatus Babeliales bacterium]